MKAIIIGNLGKDAVLKEVGENKVLNFSVADTIGFGDKQKTQWVNCGLWGKRAEGKVIDFLKKGQQVYVLGEVSQREYTDRDGVTKTVLECRIDDLKLLGGKKDAASSGGSSAPKSAPATGQGALPFGDDDIPF